MKKDFKKIISFTAIVFVLLVLLFSAFKNHGQNISAFYDLTKSISRSIFGYIDTKGEFELQKLVAHAGSEVNGVTGSNSLEALNEGYNNGFRFIELDFEWTSDGHLVLIHDWNQTVSRLFNVPAKIYDLDGYANLTMAGSLTQMTLDDLAGWVREHPDVYIVTDIKRYNVKGLKTIREHFPWMVKKIIPQIYYFEEYWLVRKMGYRHIILTLYRSDYSDEEVLDFAGNNYLAAVTMPIFRARAGLPAKLKKSGIPAYAHTINSVFLRRQLYDNDIFGIYTDRLTP